MTKRLGIIGAGKVGTTVGRLALAAGWEVRIAVSGRQPLQGLIVETMLPGARLLPEAQVVAESDIVLLAVPLSKVTTLDLPGLSGKVVVDAMNHWYPVDGALDDLEGASSSTAWVSGLNPAMRLVKSLNHLGYHDMETDARPPGDPDRRAVAVASDDPEARAQVAALLDDLGFDPVEFDAGAAGHLQGDSPVFGRWVDAAGLRAAIERARTTAA
ncbi:NAD(P)-binding domain-containing protein [Propioniciclava coleopterorum]|uniref:NAD(P)-binding domain-containing protein n=1 Tax=Propioniciclava coleopterorum TaxID=2714937 RepID=A0A6G7Y588_9ACTN|nr:NAD(P)-binding domain-containing protein [Propioniciclava coleopterorum]QIK71787.1 NAD(P)-binding domain-containing protein [Propioniciclava coleopterorum]